jgi:hypothetical protein
MNRVRDMRGNVMLLVGTRFVAWIVRGVVKRDSTVDLSLILEPNRYMFRLPTECDLSVLHNHTTIETYIPAPLAKSSRSSRVGCDLRW